MWESREVGYPTVCQRDKNFGSRNVVVPLSMSKG